MPDVQETIDTVGEVVEKVELNFGKVLSVLVMIGVGIVISRLMLVLTDRVLRRSHLDERVKRMIWTAIKYLIRFLLAITILAYLNVEVTSLVAVLSVAVFAVSLALQNLLSNVAGGLQILSTKPYALGDYIEVGSVAGTVMETGLFYTRIRTFDYKLIQVPNSQITEEKIINYSAEPTRRVDVRFRVLYSEPVEKVQKTVIRMLEAHPNILPDPVPTVRVSGFGESSMEYFVRAWCANADYWNVYFDVMEGIKRELDRAGIGMAYNHLNVHMVPAEKGIGGKTSHD